MRTEEPLTFETVLQALREEGKCSGRVNPTAYHAMKPLLEAELGCPVLSKSTLTEFMASPYRYILNKNTPKKPTENMALGSLVDCLTLTPELFETQYLCEPLRVQLKKDGTPYADGRQDPAQRDEWAAKAEQGITVITEAEKERGQAIAEQAFESLSFEGLILGKTYTSQVGMWVYLTELAGQELACPVVVTGMLDILPTHPDADRLWDLKTTSVDVGNASKVCYTMEDFHYGMQAALYADLWKLCSGEEETRKFSFMFVGTSLPLLTRAVHVGEDVLALYREEYAQAIAEYTICHKLNDWGMPQQDDIIFTPSAREYKRIAKLEA